MVDRVIVPGVSHDWLHFVSRSGDDGRRWAEDYRRQEHEDLIAATGQALSELRLGRLAQGRRLLDRAEKGLQELDSTDTSVAHVLRRWFHATFAYWEYLHEDFAGAERSLSAAHDAVCKAIEMRPFLVPLASHCSDFRLQRIRIARNQRRWQEMAERIELVRRMLVDGVSLCTLATGTNIYFSTIADFYRAIVPLGESEQEMLKPALDVGMRMCQFERFVEGLYALPGFVIGYP